LPFAGHALERVPTAVFELHSRSDDEVLYRTSGLKHLIRV
jgi:hypothetical protein